MGDIQIEPTIKIGEPANTNNTNKVVYLDTETTSLNPGQICEMSLIVEENNTFKYAKNYYFKVDSMDRGAQAVHNLSMEALEQLSGGKVFSDYASEIYEQLNGATLVAHNLPFDEKFISQELWRCGISFKPFGRYDTMEQFKDVLKIPARYKKYGPYKNPKLSEVVHYFGISEQKISWYSNLIFNCNDNKSIYHDSKFDTTSMYVAVNTYKEMLYGGDKQTSWRDTFGKC